MATDYRTPKLTKSKVWVIKRDYRTSSGSEPERGEGCGRGKGWSDRENLARVGNPRQRWLRNRTVSRSCVSYLP
jgi:hypothetical protein